MNELRSSRRIGTEQALRLVPATDRKSSLQEAFMSNISEKGMSILTTMLPPENKYIELYYPVSDQKLIAILAEKVWLGLDDSLSDKPHWVRGGYRLYFRCPEDESLYVKRYFELGGHITQGKIDPRIDFVF